MNLDSITPTGFILAMFIRNDGERFLLGDGDYTFTQKQLLFSAVSITFLIVFCVKLYVRGYIGTILPVDFDLLSSSKTGDCISAQAPFFETFP